MTYRALLIIPSVLALMACEPQTIDRPTGSGYGTESLSQTATGLDASSLIITTSEVARLEPADMIDQMIAEMDAINDSFDAAETYADAASLTRQVEMAGTNYRTMILRVQRERDAGNEAVIRRLNKREARLRRSHAELMSTGARMERLYPDSEARFGERFDKFNFGMLATRKSDRARPRLERGDVAPR